MGKLEKNNIILKSTVDGVRKVKSLVEDGTNLGDKIYFIKEGKEEYVIVGKLKEVESKLKGLSYQVIKEFGEEDYGRYVKDLGSENIQIIGRSLYGEVNSLIAELEEFGGIEELDVESDMTLIDYIGEIKEHEPKYFNIRRSLGKEVGVIKIKELESKLLVELNKEEVKLDIIFGGFRQILSLGLVEGEIELRGVQYVTSKGILQSQLEEVTFNNLVEIVN